MLTASFAKPDNLRLVSFDRVFQVQRDLIFFCSDEGQKARHIPGLPPVSCVYDPKSWFLD